MNKKFIALLCAIAMTATLFAGCGNKSTQVEESVVEESDMLLSDQEAADACAALIDAIYVQTRTGETDAQCEAAKAAWDALTDAQKELVEGENADYDYFGLDTGDASLDNPRNQDQIGDNEILVVSFGTSFNDSRVKDIKGIEDSIANAYPDWSVRRAFTAQIIINHIQARDGEKIDNVEQALDRAVNNGVKNLVVQPTHLMQGAEYDELVEAVDKYSDKFEAVSIADPLLGKVGAEGTDTNSDKEAVAKAIYEDANSDIEQTNGLAFVFMGHGTSHTAKVTYTQMQTQFENLGYNNVFVGTVEGEPEETSCENVIDAVNKAGYTQVVLRPLMVVAGDHANNDMAGDDEDSWKSMFTAANKFESIDTQICGLGSIPAVQSLYVEHTAAAIKALGDISVQSNENAKIALANGVYKAKFDTDSGMFHVNEANNGLGELTVTDQGMTIHVSLSGTGILNLYLGTADSAKNAPESELLQPTNDTVKYADGTTEDVYGFDIPVEELGIEFDCALIGSKGKWYDHKVMVILAE